MCTYLTLLDICYQIKRDGTEKHIIQYKITIKRLMSVEHNTNIAHVSSKDRQKYNTYNNTISVKHYSNVCSKKSYRTYVAKMGLDTAV